MIVRRLQPGDEGPLRSFLHRHAASSMFLLGALHEAGLGPGESPLHGVWLGAMERGELRGVVAHLRMGNAVLQAPDALPLLLRYLADEPRDWSLRGFVGPRSQVVAARQHPRSPQQAPRVDTAEILFALALEDLRPPEPLITGELQCVLPGEADLELLVRWGVAYNVESLGAEAGLRAERRWRVRAREGMERQRIFMLLRGGEPVAMSGFNAVIPGAVQVGGVFVPPALRGHGFARACVAGSLAFARGQGVQHAVLFTEPANPAQRAYRAIGFSEVGRYGVVLWELP